MYEKSILTPMKNFLLTAVFYMVSIFNHAQFPEFEIHIIGDTDNDLLGQTSLADIDKDGDLDWIVGSTYGTVWWFEYIGPDNWKKHILGEDAITFIGGTSFDVDGDGWIDQVSGQTWFRNPGEKGGQFERFENGAIIAYDNVHGDINGDGLTDLVSLSEEDGLYLYLNPKKPERKWSSIKISDGIPGGLGPNGIADLNGDNRPDIIRGNFWYENTGDPRKWIAHPSFSMGVSEGKYAHSSRVWAVDMDGDGDNDVVMAQMNIENARIVWFENKNKIGTNWFMHTIDYDTQQDFHSLAVFDFDNDGDWDVFSGGARFTKDFQKKCYIWENVNGEGTEWKRHEILTGYECHEAVAGDVDGDGDIDICIKPWKGTTNIYLRNMLMENKK
jgi:hypothetical protein